jgi:hypothetical protein
MKAQFRAHAVFRLAIAPEGTRRRTEHWKSGFYHLAREARVPLALGYIDYPKREIGVGAYVELTGDLDADMARLARSTRTSAGCIPSGNPRYGSVTKRRAELTQTPHASPAICAGDLPPHAPRPTMRLASPTSIPRAAAMPASHDTSAHHSHAHHGHAQHAQAHATRRALWLALGLTGGFAVVEALFGLLAGSLALVSDAGTW